MTITIGSVLGTGSSTGTDTCSATLTTGISRSTSTVSSAIIVVVAGTCTDSTFANYIGPLMVTTDDSVIGLPYSEPNQDVNLRPLQKFFFNSTTSGHYVWFGSGVHVVLHDLSAGNILTVNWRIYTPGFLDMSIRLHAIQGLNIQSAFGTFVHPGLYVSGGRQATYTQQGSLAGTPITVADQNDPTNLTEWHDLSSLSAGLKKTSPTDVVTTTWSHPVSGAASYSFDLPEAYFGYRFETFPEWPSFTNDTLNIVIASSPNRTTTHFHGASQLEAGPGWPYSSGPIMNDHISLV